MPEPQLLDILLHDRVDPFRAEVSAQRLVITANVHRAKQGAIPVLAVSLCRPRGAEALRRLGMYRQGMRRSFAKGGTAARWREVSEEIMVGAGSSG
jgi:hypothetical protein